MHKNTQTNAEDSLVLHGNRKKVCCKERGADLGRWFSRGSLLDEHISARQVLLAQWAAYIAVLQHLDHHAAELGIPALVISLS